VVATSDVFVAYSEHRHIWCRRRRKRWLYHNQSSELHLLSLQLYCLSHVCQVPRCSRCVPGCSSQLCRQPLLWSGTQTPPHRWSLAALSCRSSILLLCNNYCLRNSFLCLLMCCLLLVVVFDDSTNIVGSLKWPVNVYLCLLTALYAVCSWFKNWTS